jgi:lysyl-tRNA synthetase, class II
MASQEEIREARLKKLEILRDKDINAYPISSKQDLTCLEVREKFESLGDKKIYLAGRIVSMRSQGKIIFIDIDDGTGRFQALLKKEEPLAGDTFDLFAETFDIGDYAELHGSLFLTNRNEKTLLVEDVRMLSKSLRPLPEKWHGLQEVEERFRKRYLDLLSNPEVKERFLLRTKIVTQIRRILDDSGYVEVETPALQPLYGGASAEPFMTHHNALDTDLYLRISDELYLKRLLVGGLPKVYEIARDFRNEGIDATHNPEFTMLEFYEAFSDAPKMMKFVEEMVREVAKAVGKEKVVYDDKEVDFTNDFEVHKYADVIEKYSGQKSPLDSSQDELHDLAKKLGASPEKHESVPKLLDAIFKKAVKPNLIKPTFIVDYPKDLLPLTKVKDGEENIVDAFQLYAGGVELAKAFSELNDPIDQRKRFEREEKVSAEGEKDAQPLDEEFLEAMEYGMPPAGGVGIGIDRLAMLLSGAKNVKEVILFPTLRPKEK